MANRIKVTILGNTYTITTDSEEERIRRIERQLEEDLTEIMDSKRNLSSVDALVIIALNLLDQLDAGEEATDRMRDQLSQYLEDAARARIELEEARREVERLKRELEMARGQARK